MKITAVSVYSAMLTSHAAYHMADGKTADSLPSILVKMETDGGRCGWGEVCPLPHYLPAYPGGVAPALEYMAPLLLGADPTHPEALLARLDAHLPGHHYAKSAADIAFWDLAAQNAGLPLCKMLGGMHQPTLPLYHSITCIAPEEMARIAKDAHDSGIRQFQVKLGADGDWQTDVARMRLVREAVGEGPLVYGDWNNGATMLEAVRVARAVADMDAMLEQPCPTIAECAAVKAATGLPMKLDEAAHDIQSLIDGNAAGCMDAVAVKLSKFGGVSACRRARDLCEHFGASMCVEDTWGGDIATAASLHLGASARPRCLLNVCDLSGYVRPRLDKNAPVRNNGRIAVPQTPGLGAVPDESLLGKPVAEFK